MWGAGHGWAMRCRTLTFPSATVVPLRRQRATLPGMYEVNRRMRVMDQTTRPTAAEAAAVNMRAVHRAASELRRGTPVRLRLGQSQLVVVGVETVGARGLAEFAAAALAAPVLLLAASRATALPGIGEAIAGADAVALRVDPELLDPAQLRGLADPTAAQLLREPPARVSAPFGADAALALTKLARLLPAALVAPAAAIAPSDLLEVAAEQVSGYGGSAAASLRRVAEAPVPLEDSAETRLVCFRAADGGIEHLAIVVGTPERIAAAGGAPLVRLHSECFTGDLLGSLRCDCGPQLRGAIRRMAAEGAGVLLYLAQEGRGIGLPNKLRAYALQCQGFDTLDANQALGWGADERNFLIAAAMLDSLGIHRVRLLTNNPAKIAALDACGIEVLGREPHAFAANGVNDDYLATKARRFGHLLA